MRRRLILAIAGVATTAVALFAVPLAFSIQHSQREAELLRLQRDTVAFTRQIDLAPGQRDPVEVPPNGDRLTVYDSAGRRISGSRPGPADPLVRRALRERRPETQSSSGLLTVAVPLLNGERLAGAVRAQRRDDAVAGAVYRAWLGLAGIALAVIAAAVAAAVLLGRRLAAPLERLAAAAQRLGSGDFSVRAPRTSIAELDAVAESLDATSVRLDELITRERSFSADASHQLRTPLAALRLDLEALELRGTGQEPELADSIRQVDRLQVTIDTLLAAARDVPRTATTADLGAIADAARERWQAALAARSRPLRIEVDTPSPRFVGSPAVVEEILNVLLDNAVAHGRGTVAVVAEEPTPHWPRLVVRDEGHALRGRDLEALFARRADGERHGIGLALARSLATAEGGTLTAAVGQGGTEFRLTLRGPSEP